MRIVSNVLKIEPYGLYNIFKRSEMVINKLLGWEADVLEDSSGKVGTITKM